MEIAIPESVFSKNNPASRERGWPWSCMFTGISDLKAISESFSAGFGKTFAGNQAGIERRLRICEIRHQGIC
ncbi:MAG: hypothetical protein J6B53_00550 [Clostridia bacterium]|nr:hypothetical protein [Clostridia bacterium]